MVDERLEIDVADELSLVNSFVNAGCEYRLKGFYDLPTYRKEELLCESLCQMYANYLICTCSPTISFERMGNTVKVVKKIEAVVEGISSLGAIINKKVKLDFGFKLNFELENTILIVRLESDANIFENVTSKVNKKATKKFQSFKVMLSNSAKESYDDISNISFWAKMLGNYNPQNSKILSNFIAVLNSHKLFDLSAHEVELISRIYQHALKAFPLFKASKKQLSILDSALSRYTLASYNIKGITLMAKMVFEEISKQNLHKYFRAGSGKVYTNGQKYMTKAVVNGQERERLKFIEYEYRVPGEIILTRCFNPYDLWITISGECNLFV